MTANHSTVLFVYGNPRTLCPASETAFKVGQGSTAKIRRNIGAEVYRRDGTFQTIRDIRIGKPVGDTVVSRLLSRMTTTKSIEVEFSDPQAVSTDELKALLPPLLGRDAAFGDPMLVENGNSAAVIEAVRRASTVEEIFDTLRLPAPEDCLDVL